MATLVVGGDGNIDELGWGVSVAEGDDGDVDVAGLLDGLGVGARVGDDNQARLLEGTGDVVGEGTRGETTGNGLGAGVGGELQDGTLTIGTGGDNADIGGVVNGGDDASGEDNLLPGERASELGQIFGSRSLSTYQVLPTLMTLTPSARVFHR